LKVITTDNRRCPSFLKNHKKSDLQEQHRPQAFRTAGTMPDSQFREIVEDPQQET
jgi:hypothetical protein